MSTRVLAVGNCYSDHSSIARLIHSSFDAKVDRARGGYDALELLRIDAFALVLVNRKMTGGDDGMELIRQIKSDPQLAATPVMLLSDDSSHQATAVSHGAERGFGKSQLDDPAALERLARFLPSRPTHGRLPP